jgi:hypothetical protein
MIRPIFLLPAIAALLIQACATPGGAGDKSDTATQQSARTNESAAEPPAAVAAAVPKTNAGYSGTPSAAEPAPPVEPPKISPEQLLQEGTALYDKGDYRGAIRKLTSARDAVDDASPIKKSSLRLLAFSFCVSNQKVPCKQQFASLLKIDPSFQLSRGEAGHPLWGPVFKEAKASSPPVPAAAPATAPKKK